MDHLLREKAPISELGWAEIDAEATRSLKHYLAARKVVAYDGDGDWTRSARSLGRVQQVPSGESSLVVHNRVTQPLTELRVNFTIARAELDALERGATDFDTDPLVHAARIGAHAEDKAVFSGNEAAGIVGIAKATPHDIIRVDRALTKLTHSVAKAMDLLQDFGVDGPYALAVGPDFWTGIMETAENGGYPLIKHLRILLEAPVVWAPAVDGALVISQRGGDFEIVGGQDWSIGFDAYDDEKVELYLEESFTFAINSPEAAVHLHFDE